MVASVHPSVIKRQASTGENLPLADPDFYKGIPSAVAGAPADTINLLADLNKAQAQVEQGEDFLPSFLGAMEENPYEDRFGTSEYIQSLLGGDPESGASTAGYLSTAAINPALGLKAALPLLLTKVAKVGKNIKRTAPDKDTFDALNITDEGMKEWRAGRQGAKLLRNKELEDASLDLANESIPMEQRIKNFQNALQKAYPLEDSKYTIEQYQEIVDNLPTPKEIAMAVGTKSKKGVIGVNDTLKSGDIIELRLDIPAYKDTNTWVVTAHKPASAKRRQADKVLGYGSTGYIKNVTFENMDVGRTFQVQAGDANKFPMSTMKGEWIDHDPKELAELAKKLIDDPEWTQIGFNPKKSLTFYERGTMNPVLDAEEVIQIGNVVLAKKATLGKPMENIYEVGEQGMKLTMPNTRGVGRATEIGERIPAGTEIPFSAGGPVNEIDIFGEY